MGEAVYGYFGTPFLQLYWHRTKCMHFFADIHYICPADQRC